MQEHDGIWNTVSKKLLRGSPTQSVSMATRNSSWKNCETQSSLQDGLSDCDNFSDETNKFAKSKLSRVIVKKLQYSNLVFPKYLNCADWDKKLLRNIWEIDNQSKLRARNATSLMNEFCNNATDHDLVMILTNIYFE